jgi:hypothetical protein
MNFTEDNHDKAKRNYTMSHRAVLYLFKQNSWKYKQSIITKTCPKIILNCTMKLKTLEYKRNE